MSKRLQTIYEYLKDYTEQEIDEVLFNLSPKEQELLKKRYGNNFHELETHPSTLDSKTKSQFYGTLIPKIRRQLYLQHITYLKYIDLFQQIDQEKSHNSICENLKINYKELYDLLLHLQTKGVMIKRRYYSDGTIHYKKITTVKELRKNASSQVVITRPNENSLKLLAISDLHFGNCLERVDLADRVFNYCSKKGIHLILCGGDLIDGTFTRGKQKISNQYQQIEYFLRNYPFDPNILTFGVAGDHDLSALTSSSLSIIEACNHYRHDIVIGDYSDTEICLKNDHIHLSHQAMNGELKKGTSSLVLYGHSHCFRATVADGKLHIRIPALSEIIQPKPTALEITLNFSKGYISNTTIQQICFETNDILLSELNVPLKVPSDQITTIKNVEKYKSSKPRQFVKE